MHVIVSAIFPVFLLILVGVGLKQCGVPGKRFWPAAERLTYFVLFPVLIAGKLAVASYEGMAVAPTGAAIALAILTMAAALVAVRPRIRTDGPGFTSVTQGAIRMNTYIGLSLAEGVHGQQGLEAAALAVGVIVPLVNILCVLVLECYAGENTPSARSVLGQVLRNPLIIACAVGGGLNISGVGLPALLAPAVESIGKAALPIGLLTVGAAIRPSAIRTAGSTVFVTSGLKLILLPLITLLYLSLFRVSGIAAFVAILFNALPTAPSAYVLAKHMKGDATLMASLIAIQTCLSILTLPIWIAWFR